MGVGIFYALMATQSFDRPDLFERSRKEEELIRVQDYLNDKFQESADLVGIDSLLEDVKNQQKLLRQQVCIALLAVAASTKFYSSRKMRSRPSTMLPWYPKLTRRMSCIDLMLSRLIKPISTVGY